MLTCPSKESWLGVDNELHRLSCVFGFSPNSFETGAAPMETAEGGTVL